MEIFERSTAEGALQEGGEEVLGLTQRLALHGTQALHTPHKGSELLLEAQWRHNDFDSRGVSPGETNFFAHRRLRNPAKRPT